MLSTCYLQRNNISLRCIRASKGQAGLTSVPDRNGQIPGGGGGGVIQIYIYNTCEDEFNSF